MKKGIFMVLLPLLFAAAAVSCRQAGVDGKTADGTLELTLEMLEQKMFTRSSITAGEDMINNVNILVYEDGLLIDQVYLEEEVSATLAGLRMGAAYNIYALANAGEIWPPDSESALGDIRLQWMGVEEMSLQGFPMSGSSPIIMSRDLARDGLTIELERLVARYDVTLDCDALDGDFVVTSARIVNSADGVSPFVESNAVQSAADVTSGDQASPYDVASCLNNSAPASFYMFENMQGVPEALRYNTDCSRKSAENLPEEFASRCTYIEIEGLYSDNGLVKEMTYRFYLGEDELSSFDIVRNSVYTVLVRLTPAGTMMDCWKITPGETTDNRTMSFVPDCLDLLCLTEGATTVVTSAPFGYDLALSDDLLDAGVTFAEGADGQVELHSSQVVSSTVNGLLVATTHDGRLSAQCSISLLPPRLEYITLAPEGDIDVGENKQLEVTAFYSDGSSRDVTDLCSFDEVSSNLERNGSLVLGVQPGEACLEASYGNCSDELRFFVNDVVTELEVEPQNFNMMVGQMLGFTVRAHYLSGADSVVTSRVLWDDSSYGNKMSRGGSLFTALLRSDDVLVRASYAGLSAESHGTIGDTVEGEPEFILSYPVIPANGDAVELLSLSYVRSITTFNPDGTQTTRSSGVIEVSLDGLTSVSFSGHELNNSGAVLHSYDGSVSGRNLDMDETEAQEVYHVVFTASIDGVEGTGEVDIMQEANVCTVRTQADDWSEWEVVSYGDADEYVVNQSFEIMQYVTRHQSCLFEATESGSGVSLALEFINSCDAHYASVNERSSRRLVSYNDYTSGSSMMTGSTIENRSRTVAADIWQYDCMRAPVGSISRSGDEGFAVTENIGANQSYAFIHPTSVNTMPDSREITLGFDVSPSWSGYGLISRINPATQTIVQNGTGIYPTFHSRLVVSPASRAVAYGSQAEFTATLETCRDDNGGTDYTTFVSSEDVTGSCTWSTDAPAGTVTVNPDSPGVFVNANVTGAAVNCTVTARYSLDAAVEPAAADMELLCAEPSYSHLLEIVGPQILEPGRTAAYTATLKTLRDLAGGTDFTVIGSEDVTSACSWSWSGAVSCCTTDANSVTNCNVSGSDAEVAVSAQWQDVTGALAVTLQSATAQYRGEVTISPRAAATLAYGASKQFSAYYTRSISHDGATWDPIPGETNVDVTHLCSWSVGGDTQYASLSGNTLTNENRSTVQRHVTVTCSLVDAYGQSLSDVTLEQTLDPIVYWIYADGEESLRMEWESREYGISAARNVEIATNDVAWCIDVPNSSYDNSAWSVQTVGDILVVAPVEANESLAADRVGTVVIRCVSDATKTATIELVQKKERHGAVSFTVDNVPDVPASGGVSSAPVVHGVRQVIDGVSRDVDEYEVEYSLDGISWSTLHTGVTGQYLGSEERPRQQIGTLFVRVISNGVASAVSSVDVYQQHNRVESIQVSLAQSVIGIGENTSATATADFTSGLSQFDITSTYGLTWSVTDAAVASLAGDYGNVAQGLSGGECNVVASWNSPYVTSPVSGRALLEVRVQPVSISVSPSSAMLAYGQDQSFVATVTMSDGSVIRSDNPLDAQSFAWPDLQLDGVYSRYLSGSAGNYSCCGLGYMPSPYVGSCSFGGLTASFEINVGPGVELFTISANHLQLSRGRNEMAKIYTTIKFFGYATQGGEHLDAIMLPEYGNERFTVRITGQGRLDGVVTHSLTWEDGECELLWTDAYAGEVWSLFGEILDSHGQVVGTSQTIHITMAADE